MEPVGKNWATDGYLSCLSGPARRERQRLQCGGLEGPYNQALSRRLIRVSDRNKETVLKTLRYKKTLRYIVRFEVCGTARRLCGMLGLSAQSFALVYTSFTAFRALAAGAPAADSYP